MKVPVYSLLLNALPISFFHERYSVPFYCWTYPIRSIEMMLICPVFNFWNLITVHFINSACLIFSASLSCLNLNLNYTSIAIFTFQTASCYTTLVFRDNRHNTYLPFRFILSVLQLAKLLLHAF